MSRQIQPPLAVQDPHSATPAYPLHQLLQYSGYPINIQNELLTWFTEYIQPEILPALRGTSCWTPSLTWNHSPFEPSLNISEPPALNGQSSVTKTVRFSIEPVASCIRSSHRCFSLTSISLSTSSTNNMFQKLEKNIRHAVAKGITGSSHFCAFDFAGNDKEAIDNKIYFILDRLALLKGMNPAALAQESVANLDADRLTSFGSGLSKAISYLDRADSPMTVDDVEMLAVDCKVLSQAPRVKLYTHSYNYSFEAMEHVLTLGGLLSQQGQTQSCLALLEDLCRALFSDELAEHPSNEWKSLQLKPVIDLDNRRAEFIYSFEVKSGKALPEVKFYLPIRFYNATDASTIRKLSNFFESRGWHEMAKAYKYALQEVLPMNKLDTEGGTHTYLAFAYSKTKGAYTTLYWQPKMASKSEAKL
ncbi:aromatic prenyltransferase [Venturia nashicola]|uniref:Aromatic prenyltransferase n=1 Tax=Venturia nashicola TaxID=86259 RepID=A0A4Z1P3S2_9PEZI|nr:aromatic prenyltransferase [Venturia nashicola]TLD35509.1 aromatic prenyltransferase [Venturia nashicola]